MVADQDQQVMMELLGGTPKGKVTLDQALTHYETIYMPARNYAAKTRVNYRNDITDLMEFLQGNGLKNPEDVSLNDLEAYLAELDRRGYTGSTRARKTFAIKSFFSFLVKLEQLQLGSTRYGPVRQVPTSRWNGGDCTITGNGGKTGSGE